MFGVGTPGREPYAVAVLHPVLQWCNRNQRLDAVYGTARSSQNCVLTLILAGLFGIASAPGGGGGSSCKLEPQRQVHFSEFEIWLCGVGCGREQFSMLGSKGSLGPLFQHPNVLVAEKSMS